jgi:hypothetical protein
MNLEEQNLNEGETPQLNIGTVSCRIYYVAGKLDKDELGYQEVFDVTRNISPMSSWDY